LEGSDDSDFNPDEIEERNQTQDELEAAAQCWDEDENIKSVAS